MRKKLAIGIRKVASAVGSTMGTGGSNAILEAIENPHHLVTNDGYSIANAVHLSDPVENMGKNILLEAINRANKASGDGSSTTCVLTEAMIQEGQKHLNRQSPMELKRALEACIPVIEKEIKEQTREITVDDVGMVASISAEDKEIGARIQEIYEQIGKDGIIHWDISKTAEDSYTIGKGLTIEGSGFFSHYMNDADESGADTGRVRVKNAKVLITKQKIVNAGEFNDLFQALFQKDIKDIVVFCDEIDPLVMPDLIKTRAVRGFRTILVKMPLLWKDQWYEDLALASGATVIDPVLGLNHKSAKLEHLGNFDNITVTKSEVFIDGIKDLSAHIAGLQLEDTDDSNLRASRLNTKTARYFVGAHSDSALSYRRLKVEDAISASWQALQGGVVIGGGLALAKVAETIDNKILRKALLAPYKQISKNMNRDYTEYDMLTEVVFDPAPVVLNAVKNAISVAATVLTATTVVTLPRQEVEMPNFAVQT